jgi:hypothetical protein
MRQRANLITLLFALFLTATPFLKAQDNSSMTGVITDVTGAVVPGTTVQLVNTSRGITFTVKSDNDGSYRFPNVPPAPGYAATFTHDGFSALTIDNITLIVANTRTQNAKLAAGANTKIEVSANNAVVTLNTTDASVGNNFDLELVNDLPIQNRTTPLALFTLQPGVTASGSVTGARTDQTSITVDGMDVNDISTGGFGTIVAGIPVDATQEFRGTVAGLTTTQGTGGGGQFQIVTKSGTNKFHGDINEYHRDTVTASNLWFNNNSNVGRTPLIRNQFGGALGGPLWKNKLYFFADFNDSRIIQSTTATRTVPLDSFRAGTISYVKATAGGTACSSASRITTAPQCIGTYSPAQVAALDPKHIGETPTYFDPTTGIFNARYPRVNDTSLGDGINTGGNRFTQPTPDIQYNGVGRLDYNFTSTQRVFIQFHNIHRDTIQSVNRFGGDPVTRPFQDRSYGFVGSHIWQIGNNKVNQFYYGDNVQVASFPLSYNPNGTTYVNGFGAFTAPYDGGNIQRRRIPIPTVRDDFNWQLGRHNVTFGGTFKFVKTSNLLTNDYNFYTMGIGGNNTQLNTNLRPADIRTTDTVNTAQWDSAFTLSLGRVASETSNYNYNNTGAALANGSGAVRRYRYYQTEIYAGDTWKVNKNLTLTYGLRYQLYSVPFEAQGAEAVPSIGFNDYFNARLAQTKAGASGNAAVPFVTYSAGGPANKNAPGFFSPNLHDLAPRFAIAYNPTSMPKLVLNASADIVYDRTVYNAVNFLQNQSSYIFQGQVTTNYGNASDAGAALLNDPRVGATFTSLPSPNTAPSITTPYTPYVTNGVPVGLSGGNSNIVIDPKLKDPYSIAFNVGMQQELPGRFILKLSYVGREGRRLLGDADASQLIDFPDAKSGQSLGAAFAGLTPQLRAGVATNAVTPQPFFEDILPAGFGAARKCGTLNCTSNTAYVAFNNSTNVNRGDITDTLRTLAQAGALPANVGIASQFAANTYVTNKGFSSYNGMLLTVSKNLSQGIKFDFNYTWSHSIDNFSAIANSTGSYICDVLNVRVCRANSDFDVQNIITSDFVAQLPFGRGRAFGSKVPVYVDELIGGWSVSGTPQWQSGVAYSATTSAFLASFNSNDPAIFDGQRGAVQSHLHKNSANQLAQFADPAAALTHFRGPIGIEYGSRNNLRGPSAFNMDLGLSKNFQILPDNRLRAVFRADAFNALNHATFSAPAASIVSSSTFGIITTQANSYRVGQFSLRLEF